MTKRKRRFCRTLRFYNQDIFGRLVIKDPKSRDSISKGYKNAKVNKFLYERKEDFFEKMRRIWDGFGPEKFAYRTDVVKIKKRFKRLKRFGQILKARLIIRKFATEMTVRQLRSYVKRATKGSFIFLKFLSLLERRIDFIVFRMNIFQTSSEARQSINHGNILLNGEVCFFPSTQVKLYDIISVVDKNRIYKKILHYFKLKLVYRSLPSYLEVNYRILSSTFVFNPKANKISYPIKRLKPTLFASFGKRFDFLT